MKFVEITKPIFHLVILSVVLFAVFFPSKIGKWEALKDIAYDEVWLDYMGDCDCTESLE